MKLLVQVWLMCCKCDLNRFLGYVYFNERPYVMRQLENLRISDKASPTDYQYIPTLESFVLESRCDINLCQLLDYCA